MFKLSEIAPAIAARMAAQQAEQEAHQAECTADPCERCGRWKPPPPSERADTWTSLAFKSVPPAYDDARLDAGWLVELVGHPAIERAKISIEARRAVFVGPPGAGKTSLAVAMFRARVEAHRPKLREGRPFDVLVRPAGARYYSAHQLAKARAMHPLGEGEAPEISEALSCPVLLLDELGGEEPRYASAVAEVVYERHAANLPTWVTMGVGPKEVATRYGGGIARRVFEGATVFKLARKP